MRLFKWSESCTLQQAYKLTDEHINPKGPLKMRNALAEEVLDRDTLAAMRVCIQKCN